MAERRRLPVLSNTPPPRDLGGGGDGGDDDEARPPWHWVGFGTVAIFAAWLPLAYVGGAISARVMAARFGPDASKEAIDLALRTMSAAERGRLMATVALPSLFALAIAAFGGGFVVGRFGSGKGTREASYSGALTAVIAILMAWAGPTLATLAASVVTALVAVAFATWGARFGLGRRPAG